MLRVSITLMATQPKSENNMTWRLFIDDERFPPADGQEWQIARNWPEVYDLIKQQGFPSYISFDHDLGDPDAEPSGHEIAKMMVEFDLDGFWKIPQDFDFYVHSQNPRGKDNIEGLLRGYLRHRSN